MIPGPMQRRLRRGGDVGSLPSLEEDNNRVPPRTLRFQDAPQPPPRVRRTSRFPELVRKESIISTYRNELYQPKIVTFMKNGDKYFEGIKVNVSSRNFRHWEVLLSELSRSIDLPAGVRNIYTPETGHRVTTLDQFQHQRAYVCASTEPFKKIMYAKIKTPTWHVGTKVKHTGTLLDLSKSLQRIDGTLTQTENEVANTNITHGQIERETERKRKKGCVRKLLFPTQQSSEQVSMIKSPPRKKVSITLPPPAALESFQFTIICAGPPPRKVVTVFLDRQQIMSWEEAHSLISESLQSSNGCMRLYSVDGMEVESLSQLWSTNKVLISTGHNDFNIGDFLQSSMQSMGDNIQSCQDKGEPMQMEMVQKMTDGSLENKSSLLPDHVGYESLQHQESKEIGEHTASQTTKDTERVDKDEHVQREQQREGAEEERQEKEGDGEKGENQTGKPISDSKQSDFIRISSLTSPVETVCETNEHPSSRDDHQDEAEVYPTNSLLTLTEDSSFLGSGSPLTVAKAATIQHLHRLAAQYKIEHGSISGSEASTNMRFNSASRPSVICPQTPLSNLSFSPHQSLVEMILPKESILSSGVSGHSTSSSSKHSSMTKSRTIGIQTDLIGDKISTIIEEEEQPSGLGMSSRKRRVTHPLFHTQTSISSQTNIAISNCSLSQTQLQKDNYTIGPVLGEGRYAMVHECHHKMSGKQYALRAINKARIFGYEDLILKECDVIRVLKHDNLVQVVDGWESSDDICMVFEHVEGTDLFDAVLHCQHFCESDVIHVMKQLSMALVYLHAHKIVHRDIKLENIFLHQVSECEWRLKLGGMGLATTVSEPLSLICGTIFYMAPEMITETGYGTKLDVWATGVVCCTLLSGIMPFGSNSKRATVSNIKKGMYAFLSPFWDKVSDEAKDFVCHLLVVSPQKRYMATQMLQHPWIEHDNWEGSQRDTELRKVLLEYLANKSASAKNAALPTLIVTALDKRKGIPSNDLPKNKHRMHKKGS